MPRDSLTVTWRMARPLATEDRTRWDSLIRTFNDEVLHPERVELVITDQYQAVAGEYAVQSPTRANPGMTAADYQAVKPDGAMAAAVTVELPDGHVAVVANAALVHFAREKTSRMLLHESKHVRLLQRDEQAYGVHRRVIFTLPPDLEYTFIWIAESLIDEYRCERALHEAGLDPLDMGSDPADYSGIVDSFEDVRRGWRRSGDVLAAYQGATSVLDRLGQYLAYGSAHVAVDPAQAARWSSIPQMARLASIVSELPGANEPVSRERLVECCVDVARMLRATLQDYGFDCYVTSDGSLYFKVLR
jgi:hypothetical protein